MQNAGYILLKRSPAQLAHTAASYYPRCPPSPTCAIVSCPRSCDHYLLPSCGHFLRPVFHDINGARLHELNGSPCKEMGNKGGQASAAQLETNSYEEMGRKGGLAMTDMSGGEVADAKGVDVDESKFASAKN
ncbi:hypothetical protein L7F22_031858 [Adiantum nelumboides]|nr:hypothetical protein [Adiantum nelumboides]